MKEAEKLDFILKAIYEQLDHQGDLIPILKSKGMNWSADDIERLAIGLEKRGFIEFRPTRSSAYASLKSEGIEFIQGLSFAHKEHSIITNNYSINNSSIGSIVNQSSNTTVNQHYHSAAKDILAQIKEAIRNDTGVSDSEKQDVIGCVGDIEAEMESGRAPKYSMKHLLGVGANIATIADLVINLAKALYSQYPELINSLG